MRGVFGEMVDVKKRHERHVIYYNKGEQELLKGIHSRRLWQTLMTRRNVMRGDKNGWVG